MNNPFTSLQQPDFLAALQKYLPRGWAWTRSPGATLTALLSAIADCWTAFHQSVTNFSEVESFPPTANAMLADWETAYGLPDPCAGPAGSVTARRQALAAKITEQGGQSIAYLIAYALQYGFVVTITPFRAARVGISCCGDHLNGPPWDFAFAVVAPPSSLTFSLAGQAVMGDPLVTWGNDILECLIRRIAPAHLVALFHYDAPEPLLDPSGRAILDPAGRQILT
jgi:uncharacterized protein YmfQ (DUF2313 family)